MYKNLKLRLRDDDLVLEYGRMAKQANGSVVVYYGGTSVLAAVTASKSPVLDIDYFPLVVNYQERTYAAGKIPGGFFKREGKPTSKEILTGRLIDRPLRPLFLKGFRNEVQVIPMTISADQINPPDVFAIIASSAALMVSDIPFNGPVGAVRVGKINGEFVLNPTFLEIENSDIDLVIAGTKRGITMVEGGGREVSEEDLVSACEFAHKYIIEIAELQEKLVQEIGGVVKMDTTLFLPPEELVQEVSQLIEKSLSDIYHLFLEKQVRGEKIDELFEEVVDKMKEKFSDIEESDLINYTKEIFEENEKKIVRGMVLDEQKRIDGRGVKDIRDIKCEIGILPRTHGSALFTRGQTQSLGITTLGTIKDEQRFDDIEGESTKNFIFHYNFPPFSVGETGRMSGPSRREIGHGMLAERSLIPMLPDNEKFPYTIRVVSEILESNGSSSMASVCSGCLSLLDAGVPIKKSVAGVAMGLIYEKDKFAVLTDILGEEDHLGDMDFKVAGTRDGVTAFQMDIKIESINFDIMRQALSQAKEARNYILDKMDEVIKEPRPEISEYAPRITTIKVDKDKIASIIGPGGRVIKDIIQKTDTNIFIDDIECTVNISGKSADNVKMATDMINYIIKDVEVGEIYTSKVVKILDFGAFVSLPGNKEGLVHISKIADHRINKVTDVLKVGDEVKVKVINIDSAGRIDLSMKDVKQN